MISVCGCGGSKQNQATVESALNLASPPQLTAVKVLYFHVQYINLFYTIIKHMNEVPILHKTPNISLTNSSSVAELKEHISFTFLNGEKIYIV